MRQLGNLNRIESTVSYGLLLVGTKSYNIEVELHIVALTFRIIVTLLGEPCIGGVSQKSNSKSPLSTLALIVGSHSVFCARACLN